MTGNMWAVEEKIISHFLVSVGDWFQGPADMEGPVYVFGFQGKGLIRNLIFKLSRRKETEGLEALSLTLQGGGGGL